MSYIEVLYPFLVFVYGIRVQLHSFVCSFTDIVAEETSFKARFNQVLKILVEFDFIICEINAPDESSQRILVSPCLPRTNLTLLGSTRQEALLRGAEHRAGTFMCPWQVSSYWVYPGLPYSSHHSNCSPIHQARLSSWGWQPAPSRDPAKPYLTDGAE